MKERPILFSAPMVRALLDGTKTQTRRAVKMPPSWDCIVYADWGSGWWPYRSDDGESPNYDNNEIPLNCPYGQPGDRVWVREAVAEISCRLTYRADTDDGAHCQVKRWTPSIHMPRIWSRILLEITGVRVERLQDISEADCWAEGIDAVDGALDDMAIYELARRMNRQFEDAAPTYAALWESINGAGSWDANPWVWVVEFKRVTP